MKLFSVVISRLFRCSAGFYIVGTLAMLYLVGCSSLKNINQFVNQVSLYNPGIISIHPDYIIYHQNDTLSLLQIRLLTEELLFNEANSEHNNQSEVKINYVLSDSINHTKFVADSATVIRKISNPFNKKVITLTIPIHAVFGKIYTLEITVKDMLHTISQRSFVTVNKQNHFTGQNFRLVNPSGDITYFRNYFSNDDSIKIICNDPSTKQIFIRFQADNSILPYSPSSLNPIAKYNFRADSTWAYDYKAMPNITFPWKGNYYIQKDSTQEDGFMATNFGKWYPRIKEPQAMLAPLQYLLNDEEFQNLKTIANVKLANDNFWLKLTTNVDQSRELIRVFYTRQSYANLYFSDIQEGWKTDRGMIYIVLGPADIITKTADSEIWTYGSDEKNPLLRIVFMKHRNPFSDNHFEMQRSDNYSFIWKSAINTWRKGKVFVLNDE